MTYEIYVIILFLGNTLFFGCRNRDKDYFCREEWTALVDRGLLDLHTAFSRDQVCGRHGYYKAIHIC